MLVDAKCDEDGCKRNAVAVCDSCGYMACEEDCGGDGSECPECDAEMTGLAPET